MSLVGHLVFLRGPAWSPPDFSDFIISVKDARLTSASGLVKADSTQLPLLSLGGSSSEQASTSKQQLALDQASYGASASRESVFSLAGPGFLTARQSCGARALGCVSAQGFLRLFLPLVPHARPPPVTGRPCWTVNPITPETPTSPCWKQPLCRHKSLKVSFARLPPELSLRVMKPELIHRAVPSDPAPSVLVAATSSESDTDDEALHSSNSRYDNQTPPCTGRSPHTHLTLPFVSRSEKRLFLFFLADFGRRVFRPMMEM